MGKHILLILIVLCLLTFLALSFTGQTSDNRSTRPESSSKAKQINWITDVIPEGGSIYSVLEKLDVPLQEIANVTYYFGNYVDVTTIQPGDTLKVSLTKDKQRITNMMFVQEPTTRHCFTARNDSLIYAVEQLPVQLRKRILEGRLEGTLDSSLLELGLLPAEKQQVNNGLEADIDFSRDAKTGDRFQVFIQERYFGGKKLPGSKILYVSYSGSQTGEHELFRYEDAEEKSVLTGLYTLEGKSNSTSGVGYPLTAIHVVSPFGSRIDPCTGAWAQHQGVDYRARYGTQVYAVANGSVVSARYSGGWGNEIRIRHGNGLVTQYAHLSSMSVNSGQKVTRGQVIGKVGSTGMSTGAHLHFGLLQGNSYLNPTQLQMVGAEKLTAKQMVEFNRQVDLIRRQMSAKTAKQG